LELDGEVLALRRFELVKAKVPKDKRFPTSQIPDARFQIPDSRFQIPDSDSFQIEKLLSSLRIFDRTNQSVNECVSSLASVLGLGTDGRADVMLF
jgi:hypothetical protein